MAQENQHLQEKLGLQHSKQSLRLWLRLLTCSAEIEKLIRNKMSREFSTTLPRFDILSALDRNPDGLTMGALSKLLMVSNGNVTGLVERLNQEGLVEREELKHDRRTFKVTLTRTGKAAFAKMAKSHEAWLEDMFESLSDRNIEQLLDLLNKVRISVAKRKIPQV